MCRYIWCSLSCVVWGDSEPTYFPVGLRSMPSIPSNLISLDTNTALSALRLVAYHLSEEKLCPRLCDLLTLFHHLYRVSLGVRIRKAYT